MPVFIFFWRFVPGNSMDLLVGVVPFLKRELRVKIPVTSHSSDRSLYIIFWRFFLELDDSLVSIVPTPPSSSKSCCCARTGTILLQSTRNDLGVGFPKLLMGLYVISAWISQGRETLAWLGLGRFGQKERVIHRNRHQPTSPRASFVH